MLKNNEGLFMATRQGIHRILGSAQGPLGLIGSLNSLGLGWGSGQGLTKAIKVFKVFYMPRILYAIASNVRQGFVLKVNLSSDNSENRSLSLHSVENSNISRNFYTIGAL